MNQVLQTKICTKCSLEKPITEFHFRKDRNTYRTECKECHNKYFQQHYQNNPQYFIAYRQKDKLRQKERDHQRYWKNPKKAREKNKEKYWKNPEKFRILDRERYWKNPEKFRQKSLKHWLNDKGHYKKYRETHRSQLRQCENNRNKIRRLTDPSFKLKRNIRSRVRLIANKSTHSIEYLGQTIPAYQSYLQAQFDSNMTHANYGKVWHIDHIIPLSFFDLSDPTEQRQAFHYTNTRPLLVKENLEKGDKILALNYNDPTPFI